MSDPADERAAYREALARAEASAVLVDEAGRETPAAPSELPGAVPVQASDQPLPVEPAAAATSPEAPAAPTASAAPEAPAETVEELIAERDRLLARVEEQKSMIGRQSAEVGEVRQNIVALEQRLSAAEAQRATAPPVAITQELIDSNPAAAVQAAFDQRNEAALQYAFEAWKEEDPFGAAVWLSGKQAEQREAAMRAELEATRAEIVQIKEPIAQQTAATADRDSWTAAFTQMRTAHPEFLEIAEKLLTEVAPQFPKTAARIADGDTADKVEGLTLLYDAYRAANPDAVRAELEQAAAAAAAEAAATANGAAVVSGQTTAGQGSEVTKTYEELEQERYVARQEGKASLSRGWTGR